MLKKEPVEIARLDVEEGAVMELTSMKELGTFLSRDDELLKWWKVHMGYISKDASDRGNLTT